MCVCERECVVVRNVCVQGKEKKTTIILTHTHTHTHTHRIFENVQTSSCHDDGLLHVTVAMKHVGKGNVPHVFHTIWTIVKSSPQTLYGMLWITCKCVRKLALYIMYVYYTVYVAIYTLSLSISMCMQCAHNSYELRTV